MELKYQPIYKCVHKALCINFRARAEIFSPRSRFLQAQLRSRYCKQGSFAITCYGAISHFCHIYFENSKFHIITRNRFKVNLMSFLFSHT